MEIEHHVWCDKINPRSEHSLLSIIFICDSVEGNTLREQHLLLLYINHSHRCSNASRPDNVPHKHFDGCSPAAAGFFIYLIRELISCRFF